MTPNDKPVAINGASLALHFDSPHAIQANIGTMVTAVGACDWSKTSLGPAEGWPQSLRSALSICLQMPSVAALYWGPDFTVIYNDAYAPVLAERHPVALGKPLSQVWPELWAVLGSQLRDVVRSGKAFSTTDQALAMHRHGSIEESFWSYSFTPVQGENNLLVGIFVAATETTAVVQANRRMAEQIQRQQRLFENAPGFIAVLQGPEHKYEFVNDAYVQLFGSRPWVGALVQESFPELKGQGFFELLDKVYQTGERYVARGAPVRVEPHDGSEARTLLVDFIYEPVRNDKDKISGIFCQGYDVTERLVAEQARDRAMEDLRAADKNKDDFLSKLAHEIRNPLSPIKTAVQVLRRLAGADQRQQRLVETIERQTDAVSALVDDLMDVSQVRLGKVTLARQQVSLQDVLNQAIETCSPGAYRNSQELILHMPSDPVHVDADRKRMVQVCCNLIGNSVKFTPDGGRIVVSLSQSDGLARVTVTDTGVGMTPETLEKIFSLFEQGPEQERIRATGLGIGLSLVKQLIELHGGSVSAESPGLGLGSKTQFSLPSEAGLHCF